MGCTGGGLEGRPPRLGQAPCQALRVLVCAAPGDLSSVQCQRPEGDSRVAAALEGRGLGEGGAAGLTACAAVRGVQQPPRGVCAPSARGQQGRAHGRTLEAARAGVLDCRAVGGEVMGFGRKIMRLDVCFTEIDAVAV